jgi:hypothetical protein
VRQGSLLAAGAIVVIANLFALVHSAANRRGDPSTEITLTQKELQAPFRSPGDDDSGVALTLAWVDQSALWNEPVSTQRGWLDRDKLRNLGFDCSEDPQGQGASDFYARQRSREAFVAMEYDGPAWRALLEATPRVANQGHLVPIDADLDAGRLRARNPNRTGVIILPAAIAIRLGGRVPGIFGWIEKAPSSIHVPLPFSPEFRGRGLTRFVQGRGGSYRVHLRYGNSLEPWVTGVDFER